MRVGWGYESPWGPDGSPSLPISFLTSTHVVIFHRMSGGSNWKSLDESIFTAAAKWIVISHQTLSPATVQGLLFHQIWIAQINSAHHQHTKQIHKIISLQVAMRTNYKIAQSKWQKTALLNLPTVTAVDISNSFLALQSSMKSVH